MRIVLANHSSYPRVGEGAEAQRVRRAYAQRETGGVDDTGYRDIVRSYVAEIIGEQESAGLEVVTDGQVGWYDAVSHLARGLDGVKINGLLRFFDTNYLVRQPEIVGALGGTIGTADDHAYAAGVAKGTVKAVLTGPYTMAHHSIIRTDTDVRSLTAAYADVLGAEVQALAGAGATLIQIEEPSLLRNPDDAELVRNALERVVANKGPARVSLVTFFGDATGIYGELVKMPVDMLGFDLVYGPRVADAIAADPPDRPVALGVIDGRNTKLDDVRSAAETVDRVASALAAKNIDEVHVQPSCGLEYLPRDRALRKLERMREVGNAIEKVGA